MHGHDGFWNLLLAGTKQWFLIPPGALGSLPPVWSDSAHPAGLLDQMEEKRSLGYLFQITQYAGDVLYVPHGWGHATLHVGETVAVSQEFCSPTNRAFIPSLTQMIVGDFLELNT